MRVALANGGVLEIISLISGKNGKLYLRLIIALVVIVAAAYAYAAAANQAAPLPGMKS